MSDVVEYEALSKEDINGDGKKKGKGKVKRIMGVDTASVAGDSGAWDWRGSGLLFFVGSHWEVLGWGERPLPNTSTGGQEEENESEPAVERWAVTWFAPTVFTAEGLDVYSDRKEGLSEGLARDVLAELKRVCQGQGKLGEIVEKDMREVVIRLPWGEA